MHIQVVSASKQAEKDRDLAEFLTEEAREIFLQQSAAIADLASSVDGGFGRSVQLMLDTPGHVIVTGIGKSGLIGQKLAATFASTGTPSFFVHAAEALHGDLGMITDRDLVLLISYSGETEEVLQLLPHLSARGVPTIALVGNRDSNLATEATVALSIAVRREVCPNNLAPTNSTLATLAVGDALAVSLMNMRDFRAEDFARLHPGGRLGRKLHTRIRDVMTGGNLPTVEPDATLRDCLVAAAQGRLGLALVVHRGRLRGIVTSVDLENLLNGDDVDLSLPVGDFMAPRPPVIDQNAWLAEAEHRQEQDGDARFVVVDTKGYLVGLLELPVE